MIFRGLAVLIHYRADRLIILKILGCLVAYEGRKQSIGRNIKSQRLLG